MSSVEERLGGNGRLLVRYSGTEPLLRVMLEGQDTGAKSRDGRRRDCRCRQSSYRSTLTRLRRFATREAAGSPTCSRPCACASRPALPASPCIRAPTSATSRRSDVHEIAELLKRTPEVEFNIEGDPRPDLLELVLKVRPTQCTLVPVTARRDYEPGWMARRLRPSTQLRADRDRHRRRSACESACSSILLPRP